MILDVFFGCLGALVFDRVVASAVQVWTMRRIGNHITRNLDKALEKRETQARTEYEMQRKARSN